MSGDGIECNPDKVAAITSPPQPTNVSEVRTFCGLASYYQSLVQNFTHAAWPRRNLMQKDATFR